MNDLHTLVNILYVLNAKVIKKENYSTALIQICIHAMTFYKEMYITILEVHSRRWFGKEG